MRRRPVFTAACLLAVLIFAARSLGFLTRTESICLSSGLSSELENRPLQTKTTLHAVILSHEQHERSCYLFARLISVEESELPVLDRLSAPLITNHSLSGQHKGPHQILSQTILIKTDAGEFAALRLHNGDSILVRGSAALFSEQRNPGETDFRSYYRNRGVLFCLEDAVIMEASHVRSPEGMLDAAATALQESLFRILPYEDAGTMCGMILGKKGYIPKERKELFQEGGIAHILAISSLHIQLLAMSLWRFLRKRRRSYAVCGLVSGTVITLFCLMTSFQVSARRALMMYIIWCFSQVTGRTADPLTSAGIAALAELLFHPALISDTGFALSYGCIISLEIISPRLRLILCPENAKIRKGMLAIVPGLAISLGTFPVAAAAFYQIAPFSCLINLFVLPVMGVLMMLGLLGAAAGLVRNRAGIFLASPCRYILMFFGKLCELSGRIPGSIVVTGKPAGTRILLYYLLLGGILSLVSWLDVRCRFFSERLPGTMRRRRCFLVRAGAFAGILCTVMLLRARPPEGLRIVFEDVGQGDGILLQTRSFAALVDCGSTSTGDVWKYHMESTLKYYGIRKLDCIFVTHGDLDHISGIRECIASYRPGPGGGGSGGIDVRRVLVSEDLREDDNLKDLALLCRQKKIPVSMTGRGDRIEAGDLSVRVLHPGSSLSEDKNENSLVLRVTYGSVSFLLTGDLGFEGEEDLLKSGESLNAQVLKVGHHGSGGSSSEAFLEAVSPALAVVSAGENNPYGHPNKDALLRLRRAGADVMRTDKGGAVIAQTDGTDILFRGWLRPHRQ